MVNALLNAATTQLGKTFGTSYRYYVENVEQNLTKPCFTVDALIPIQRSRSPLLYDRTIPIVVHYFSGSKTNLKQECYSIGEQLVECLEHLPFKNTILRGQDISYQIVDDVLQVFITYKFTTRLVTEELDAMDEYAETVHHMN
jgi:hypothetical protein